MSSLLHGGNTEDYNMNRQVPTIKNSISLSNETEKRLYQGTRPVAETKTVKCVCSRSKIVNDLNKCYVLDLTSKLPRKHPPCDMDPVSIILVYVRRTVAPGVKRWEREAERVHHVPRPTSVELRVTAVAVRSSE